MNFTNLSRYSELSERTYRRQFDEPFEYTALNSCLISQAIAAERFQVGAIDCSFAPKSGQATYGVDRFYNGKAGRAESGLEISTIAVVDVGASMAYALSVQQTPADSETDTASAPLTRVDHYLAQVKATRAALPASVRHLVGDGFYSKLKWVNGILAVDLDVIGKLRCDANLRYVYEGPQKTKGARRKYDGKVYLDERDHHWQALGEVKPGVRLFTVVVWSINLKRKIRVVYLLNQRNPQKPCKALLFSTDLELDPIQLYEAYRARFQIEFIFREAKQFTGLTDCQARSEQKLDFHFNAALTALNLAKWDAYQQRDPNQPFVFSLASYKRRKLNQHLLERFIGNLDLDETLIKSHPNYQNLCDYGALIS